MLARRLVSALRLTPPLVNAAPFGTLGLRGLVGFSGYWLGEERGEVFVGSEIVVFVVHGDEAAEAESSQDPTCALVFGRGEEGGAQSVFESRVEPGADHDGLYRVRAPGFGDA